MIRAVLARHAQRQQAGNTYHYEQARARGLQRQLIAATHPEVRADVLIGLAIARAEMAAVHDLVRGFRWVDRRRSVSTSLTLEAGLYRALFDVERARADGTRRRRTVADIEAAAGPVLDRMTLDPYGTRSPVLVAQLREAVTPVVGERAAKLLDTIGVAR